ncbi:hypothetical protein BH23VER1_BH23VER1_03730 [soil metagenome]
MLRCNDIRNHMTTPILTHNVMVTARKLALAVVLSLLATLRPGSAGVPMSVIYDDTYPSHFTMAGIGLDSAAGAATITGVDVGGTVRKAFIYWGGKGASEYSSNPTIVMAVAGQQGTVVSATEIVPEAAHIHNFHFVYRADVTNLLTQIVAGDYDFTFSSFQGLQGAGVQIVYTRPDLPNARVQIFGGLDYQFLERGSNEDGEGATLVHHIDFFAPAVDIGIFAQGAYYGLVGDPLFEQLWYKQGVGSLTSSSGPGELVANLGGGIIDSDPDATLFADNFLQGVDGEDWDTYRAHISLVPELSTTFSLDTQSTGESYSIPSVAFRSLAYPDSVVGETPTVRSTVEFEDGRILIGGSFVKSHDSPRRNIARLLPDGSLDSEFDPGSGFDGTVNSVAVLPAGQILVGGEFSSFNGLPASRVIVLNPNGTRAFPVATPDQNAVYWVGVQPDGKMLYAGNFHSVGGGHQRVGIARLNADGKLDHSFTTGSGSGGAGVRDVLLEVGGKMRITGSFTNYAGVSRNGVARLNPDGTLDAGFDPGLGATGGGGSRMAVQRDGRMLLAGSFSAYDGESANRLARVRYYGPDDPTLGYSPLSVSRLAHVSAVGNRDALAPVGDDGDDGTGYKPGYGYEVTYVKSSTDDAEEFAGGTMLLTSLDLEMAYDDGLSQQTVGVRFQVPIEPGQTVENAYIQFTADATDDNVANLRIHAEKSVSAESFASNDRNITSRLLTNNYVDWVPEPWTIGDAAEPQRTPGLKAVLQEIVDMPGWVKNGYVAFVITGTGLREAKSFEAGAQVAPALVMEFARDGRVKEGLEVLYTFDENSGTTVEDVSGTGAPLNLEVENESYFWGSNELDFTGPNRASNHSGWNKIFTACQVSNEVTLEAWLTPDNPSQGGPARILTFSSDSQNRNFTLGQEGDRYVARLRTTTNGSNGTNTILQGGTINTAGASHLVFTRNAAGSATLYFDGVAMTTEPIGGDFSGWNGGYSFGIGNEFNVLSDNDARDWQGVYHLAAVYSRALSGAEVVQNYEAGPGGRADAASSQTGSITYEAWTGIPGVLVSDLLADPDYPSNPDLRDALTTFEIPSDIMNDYGTRVHGYVVPSSTGSHVFHIAGDDQSLLYLSTDSTPAKLSAEPIASVPDRTNPREWNKYASQSSAGISLFAGQRYYVRALMKEGGGGDHLAVAWTQPGADSLVIIPGPNLAPWDGAATGSGPAINLGGIGYERWEGIAGTAVDDLTGSAHYQSNPPDAVAHLTSFYAPTNVADDYGIRIHGYLVPSTAGEYRLYVSGDDNAHLFLSPDSSPSNISAAPIASVPGYTALGEWNKYGEQKSAPVTLEAGQPYYIRAFMKDGGGADHLAVGWTGPGISTITVIPGANLAPWDSGQQAEILEHEAEDGRITGNKFIVGVDGNASGNQYIWVPEGQGGSSSSDKVTYTFHVTTAGIFRIRCNAYAPDAASDSFHVKVNGLPSGKGYTWEVQGNTSYAADYVNDRNKEDPVQVTLGVGIHTVEIAVREDGTRLDKIALERQ